MLTKRTAVWIVWVFAMALPLTAQVSPQPATMQIVTKPICEPAFTVAARASKECSFAIPEQMRVARLEGHFTATGGPRNTIQVLVLDDDAYVNWSNGHQMRPLYNSQKVTTGTIKLILTPGKYHIVFDNRFSLVTPKALDANLAIAFKAPAPAAATN